MSAILLHALLFCLLIAEGPSAPRVRIASFNIWELSAEKINKVDSAGHGTHRQLRGAAEIVQRVRPDILLVNEIDFDEDRHNATLFQDRYLKIAQSGQKPVDYPFVFFAPVNTGQPTGKDLNNDGRSDGPADAYGYGRYPGQYGMALFSRFEIDEAAVRTFQKLLWKNVPGNLMPDGAGAKPAWYTLDESNIMRLSSKSHWDVPVRIGSRVVHLLCAHPTPPVFDGPEDHNGRRNSDELRLWVDYLTGGTGAAYITDDKGRSGPLPADARFCLLGDFNADPAKVPHDFDTHAIVTLLRHPRLRDPAPKNPGAPKTDRSPAQTDPCRTTTFGRLDYALPSTQLEVQDSGVFWPRRNDPLHKLVDRRESSSDHRLVWVDVVVK